MLDDLLESLSHLPKAAVAVVAGAVLIGGGTVAALQLSSGGGSDLADASKVLQSVDVGIGQDGKLTSVKGTTVGTTTTGKPFSVDDDYAPGAVADQLPVRVLTSYRTAKGTGTDLAELDGYTGRVDITLTVQNLTQQAKNLSFDVGGTQQSRSALVGVPLTVVGSTSLPDTKPSAVITQTGGQGEGTNGVLSQDSDGKAQVQWATLLAPPQLGASTTMNLSVDAKDFEVPAFDLSVQPGLVTDPSIGSVLDEAFSPEGSTQLALTRRTIDLIGKVNGVLGQAGKSLGQTRSTLKNSSDKLGTKTVEDLKGSTQTIASSVKGLQASSTSLGRDLSSSLKGTQSATLAELQATNQAISSLLGDTSAAQPQAMITRNPSNVCEASVNAPQGATSIYGNLQEVVALLDGYSTATNGCSDVLQKRILDAIGPAVDAQCHFAPGTVDTNASDDGSATCSLFGARKTVSALAASLTTAGQNAIDAFTTSISSLNKAVNGAQGCDTTIDDNGTPADLDDDSIAAPDGCGLRTDSGKASDYAGAVGRFALGATGGGGQPIDTTAIRSAATNAQSTLKQLNVYFHGIATDGLDSEVVAKQLNDTLDADICRVAASLDPADYAKVDALRQYTSNQNCQGQAVNSDPTYNLRSRIDGQLQRWNQLESDTDPGLLSPNDVGPKFAGLYDSLGSIGVEADRLAAAVDDVNRRYNVDDIKKSYRALQLFLTQINAKSDVVSREANSSLGTNAQGCSLSNTPGSSGSTCSKFQQAFTAAVDAANGAVAQVAGKDDDKIRALSASGAASAQDVKTLFNSSLGQLAGSADRIGADAKKTIDSEKATFSARQKQSGDRISASVDKGLQQINAGVGSSVKDLGAAQKLLQGDISDVLLDLGTRNVEGSGLLGAIARGAATTGTANFQLAQATTTASSYANVRQGDIVSILLGQAQAQAGQQALAALPAFEIDLPDSTRHTTVYSLHVGS